MPMNCTARTTVAAKILPTNIVYTAWLIGVPMMDYSTTTPKKSVFIGRTEMPWMHLSLSFPAAHLFAETPSPPPVSMDLLFVSQF